MQNCMSLPLSPILLLCAHLSSCSTVESVSLSERPATPTLQQATQSSVGSFHETEAFKRGVNVRGEFGDTQLTWAVFHQNVTLVRKLLSKGADPNILALGPSFGIRDHEAETPLIGAIIRKNAAIVQLLLNRKANPNMTDDSGRTPLSFAVESNRIDIVERLLDCGANVNSADKSGFSAPLDLASSNIDIARLLIRRGAKVGESALFSAAASGSPELMRLFLSHGGNPKAKSPQGDTLVMSAAMSNRPDTVRLLVARGADVNAVMDDGTTQSGTALARVTNGSSTSFGNPGENIRKQQNSMIKLLLELGADPNRTASYGNTPLMMVRDNVDAARMLIAKGARVNAVDKSGTSALTWAVCLGSAQTVKLLMEAGAKLIERDSNGMTPVIFAAEYSNPSTLNFLLDSGHDINASNHNGETPLIAIARMGGEKFNPVRYDTAAILIRRGADVNRKDQNGKTALMAACKVASIRTVAALIAAGADVNALDSSGMTALSYAEKEKFSDFEEIVGMLKKAGARNR